MINWTYNGTINEINLEPMKKEPIIPVDLNDAKSLYVQTGNTEPCEEGFTTSTPIKGYTIIDDELVETFDTLLALQILQSISDYVIPDSKILYRIAMLLPTSKVGMASFRSSNDYFTIVGLIRQLYLDISTDDYDANATIIRQLEILDDYLDGTDNYLN